AAALRAAEEGLLQSSHDCSDGGLGVALAESCFSSHGRKGLGADVDLEGDGAAGVTAHLFAETPSRIVVSFEESARTRLEEIAAGAGCPLRVIGRVSGGELRVSVRGKECVRQAVSELEHVWRTALSGRLRAEALAAER
ncbi:MAG: hypothetical protein H0T60_13540, partial [Acidobacteria bacterium]|nr:hypothetical protein [Acidobacteriota bacterium]